MKHICILLHFEVVIVAKCCFVMLWKHLCIFLVYVWYLSSLCIEFVNWIYVKIFCKHVEHVLEAIYVFKVGFEAFEIEVYVWNKCVCQASLLYLSFEWVYCKLIFLGKQGNASSRPWYSISRSWHALHEPSSVKLDSAQNSGLLTGWYHDRDIMPHDRDHDHEQPSRSWLL